MSELRTACYLLNRLTAGEALRVLAAAGPEAAPPALAEADVRVAAFRGGWCRIVVPDPARPEGGGAARRQRLAAHAGLTAALAAAGFEPEEREAAERLDPDRFVPVDRALAWLVLHATDGEPAPPVAGQHCVILPGAEASDTAGMVRQLIHHATALRVMGGSDGAGRPVLIAHVRADADRVESFGALLGSGRLGDAPVLRAFAAARGPVFLPPPFVPGRAALDRFAALVRPEPVAAEGPDRPFAAIARRPAPPGPDEAEGAGRLDLYLLDRLRPWDAEALQPPLPVRVAVHDLADSAAAVAALRTAIAAAEPAVGHRLELRGGHPTEATDVEIERLGDEIRRLEERAVYLEGLRAPAWHLLRFGPHALPALADALRRFPASDLEGGLIRYGFQASPRDPAGMHYLLFRPGSAAMAEPFPEWRWRGADGAPIAYRLDPFWAHFYQDRDAASLVFVPERHALYPPLHSWERGDMDARLRALMAAWFPDDDAVTRLPARPVYVFSPGADAAIRIEVLDFAGFVPVRERIGWINRNLELLEAVPASELIGQMGEAAGRLSLAVRLARDADGAAGRLRVRSAEAAAAMRAELAALLDGLTGEIAETAERMRRVTAAVGERHQDLAALNDTLAEVTRAADESFRRYGDARSTAEGVTRRERAVRAELEQAVAAAERLMGHVREEVADEIDRLRRARARLQDLIDGEV